MPSTAGISPCSSVRNTSNIIQYNLPSTTIHPSRQLKNRETGGSGWQVPRWVRTNAVTGFRTVHRLYVRGVEDTLVGIPSWILGIQSTSCCYELPKAVSDRIAQDMRARPRTASKTVSNIWTRGECESARVSIGGDPDVPVDLRSGRAAKMDGNRVETVSQVAVSEGKRRMDRVETGLLRARKGRRWVIRWS
ncbi:hypothetical protein N431DRAFT_507549 [Stipitochalara longipes BDJ]|nr:hypothetical protein N431DRAFT_507549 [Stipitochalara longipes BDJ]